MVAENSKNMRLPGFYNLSLSERWRLLAQRTQLTGKDLDALSGPAGLTARAG